jgi:hypothetical protein
MHSSFPSLLTILAMAPLLDVTMQAHAASFQIRVQAGDFDRTETVVRAALPSGSNVEGFTLRHGANSIPWQLSEDGAVCFAVRKAPRGSAVDYEFSSTKSELATLSNTARFEASRKGSRIDFGLSPNNRLSQPLMSYQADPGEFPRADIKPSFKRGGYLHPIRTPSGRLVTDDFPPNHIHHHGVWWAWTHTEFGGRKPDFWNMGDGKGRVEFEAVEKTWSGPVMAGFRSRHRFVDLTSGQPVTALQEIWQVTSYAFTPGGNAWMFDLMSEQHCATTNQLRLPEYRYGGVGVRGNWAWNGKDKTFFLTANGEADREKGHATRARWCDMGGDVDGNRVGIAILDHPSNFRHPQPMRIHPTEPFFNYAPQQAGDMEIKPGAKYVSRYRFVIHDGPPDRTELDRLWNDFAHPPQVTVTRR